MADQHYTIRDQDNHPVGVTLRRDKRLRKTMRWEQMPDGSLLVRVPPRLPRWSIGPMLEQVARRLKKANARHKHRSDADLQQRADQVNQKYFNGQVQWNAIRWVSNMQAQLGSCSRGGPTDGEIRISDKIRDWPGWVLDYVIAHELMHRRHPNHSPAFWSELRTIYPLTDKARGFISGAAYVAGHPLDDAEA